MRSSTTETRGGSSPPALSAAASSRAVIHAAAGRITSIIATSEAIVPAPIHDVSDAALTRLSCAPCTVECNRAAQSDRKPQFRVRAAVFPVQSGEAGHGKARQAERHQRQRRAMDASHRAVVTGEAVADEQRQRRKERQNVGHQLGLAGAEKDQADAEPRPHRHSHAVPLWRGEQEQGPGKRTAGHDRQVVPPRTPGVPLRRGQVSLQVPLDEVVVQVAGMRALHRDVPRQRRQDRDDAGGDERDRESRIASRRPAARQPAKMVAKTQPTRPFVRIERPSRRPAATARTRVFRLKAEATALCWGGPCCDAPCCDGLAISARHQQARHMNGTSPMSCTATWLTPSGSSIVP